MTRTAPAGHTVGNPAHTVREDAIGTPPQRPTLVPAQRYYSAGFRPPRGRSGCGPRCGRSPARSTTSPNPATTSSTAAAPTPYSSFAATTASLRAFQNVCRHRGNSLCAGVRIGLARTAVRIPRLDVGSLRLAQASAQPQGFRRAPVDRVSAARRSASTRGNGSSSSISTPTRSRCVDYLEAMPDDIAWSRLGDFRCYATMTIEVDANWKTIADGFSETYHIQTLHPELHRCMDDVYAPQVIWGHTGKSEQLYGVPSPSIKESADRRRGVGRLRLHPGRADGRRGGHAVPVRSASGQSAADVIAERTKSFRRQVAAST